MIEMIVLITGASHTGKTTLAQKLLEKYKYPYLSIDHLKMGLIRSGNTELTPMSDDKDLTAYLWPIVREMVKTAIENKQNLIVEGCYIPFDWQKDFDSEYLENIKYFCLVMSEKYIRNHFTDIKKYANAIENRLDDEWCTKVSAYSAAKAAISNFTQCLATHFATTNIRVNALAPGFFVTAQNKDLLTNPDGSWTPRSHKILAGTPMNRMGEPEELLGGLLFLLCKEASGFINGIILPIDGGFNAYCGV